MSNKFVGDDDQHQRYSIVKLSESRITRITRILRESLSQIDLGSGQFAGDLNLDLSDYSDFQEYVFYKPIILCGRSDLQIATALFGKPAFHRTKCT